MADDWHGLGLARRLLEALMPSACEHGFERMEGDILATNARMLDLRERLGFVTVESSQDPGVRPARCDLAQP